ncbi:hypothetical protein [Actinocorallia aurantiaca]|uniref:hypothetical protein n=1 Tax=Actinocorallia aurantiaca TaxID=46204 RepID=UPI0031D2E5BB
MIPNWDLIVSGVWTIFRAIGRPESRIPPPVFVAVLSVSLRQLVEAAGDRLVRLVGRVLVDEGGPFVVVAHAGHQVAGGRFGRGDAEDRGRG